VVAAGLGWLGQSVAQETRTLSRRVTAATDDAEELDNVLLLTGSTLDMGDSNDVIGGLDDFKVVGIRFLDIDIPPGAAIEAATIQFVSDSTQNDGETASFRISADASANAETFNGANTVLNRGRTGASVAWRQGPLNENEVFTTEDIASVIQDVVNIDGWQQGNAIALLIAQDDVANPVIRQAKSFDGNANDAPLLTVQFVDQANAGLTASTNVVVGIILALLALVSVVLLSRYKCKNRETLPIVRENPFKAPKFKPAINFTASQNFRRSVLSFVSFKTYRPSTTKGNFSVYNKPIIEPTMNPYTRTTEPTPMSSWSESTPDLEPNQPPTRGLPRRPRRPRRGRRKRRPRGESRAGSRANSKAESRGDSRAGYR